MSVIKHILLLAHTVISGKPVFYGDVLAVPEECSLKDANTLISMRKAVVHHDSASIDPELLAIIEAIELLDDSDDSLWNDDGKPSVDALGYLDFAITAAKRDAAWALCLSNVE